MNVIGDPEKLRKEKPRKRRKLQRSTKKKPFTSKEISSVSSLYYSVLALAQKISLFSPVAIRSNTTTIDYESLAKAQLKDKELFNFLESNHSLKIKSVPVVDTSFTLFCDETISGKLRPLVPFGHGRTIFNSIHNLSHSSIKATIRMIADRYVWPDVTLHS